MKSRGPVYRKIRAVTIGSWCGLNHVVAQDALDEPLYLTFGRYRGPGGCEMPGLLSTFPDSHGMLG